MSLKVARTALLVSTLRNQTKPKAWLGPETKQHKTKGYIVLEYILEYVLWKRALVLE